MFESGAYGEGTELTGALTASEAAGELERLYERHGRAVLGHCTRLLRDVASAEDATQEVFLRVRGAIRLPPAHAMRPWLLRVATNYCLNELRRRNVRAHGWPPFAGFDATSPEDALAARRDARDFLEQLTPRTRAVTWLTYVDGMLQREVAAALGVSRRTVVSELHRAQAAMVSLL
jgi:RNA polymerase sigma-70 factor (ECF subfamily)